MMRGHPSDRGANEATRFKHLLLVAGPSGGGKSTFMNQLSGAALPEEVTRHIPDGVADWLQVDGKTFVRMTPLTHDKAGAVKPLPGLVYHYDINRPYTLSLRRYEDDPALGLLVLAERVLVVSILPEPRRLISQHEARARRRHLEKSRTLRRKILNKMQGRPKGSLKESQERLLALYRTHGWLEDRYQRWIAYLERAARRHASLESIFLDLGDENDTKELFRLADVWQTEHPPSAGIVDA